MQQQQSRAAAFQHWAHSMKVLYKILKFVQYITLSVLVLSVSLLVHLYLLKYYLKIQGNEVILINPAIAELASKNTSENPFYLVTQQRIDCISYHYCKYLQFPNLFPNNSYSTLALSQHLRQEAEHAQSASSNTSAFSSSSSSKPICTEHILQKYDFISLKIRSNYTSKMKEYDKIWKQQLETAVSDTPKQSPPSVFQTFLASIMDNMFQEYDTFLFAKERGFLYLKNETRNQYNISQFVMELDWTDDYCFGDFFPQKWIINWLLGYDSIMIREFAENTQNFAIWKDVEQTKKLQHYLEQQRVLFAPTEELPTPFGSLFSYTSNMVYHLQYSQQKSFSKPYPPHNIIILIKKLDEFGFGPLLLYIIVFGLVYYTLRQTHGNLIIFFTSVRPLLIQLMNNRGTQNRILFTKTLLRSLFENFMLIPMMFGIVSFVAEFLDDYNLSLMFIGILWVAQTYLILVAQAPVTKRLFPWFLHFCVILFLLLLQNSPFGYSYFAIFILALVIVHLMIYFWIHCEFPLIMQRLETFQQQRTGETQIPTTQPQPVMPTIVPQGNPQVVLNLPNALRNSRVLDLTLAHANSDNPMTVRLIFNNNATTAANRNGAAENTSHAEQVQPVAQ